MAVYSKIEDLRNRKEKLRKELERLDKKIRETGERAASQGLKTLLQKGEVKTPLRSELQELQQRYAFLQQVDKKIDKELVRTTQHNRYLTIKKLEKQIAGATGERDNLNQKRLALLQKIEKLKKKDIAVKEKRTTLETELRAIKRPEKTVSLRLNQLENFLQSNFLLGDDLKQQVLRAREHNKQILKQAQVSSSDTIYRNFEITFSLETGKTLKLSLLEQNPETILRNFDKKKLIREVT